MRLLAAVLMLLLATPAIAQTPTPEELARRVDALTRELEAMRLGAVADTTLTLARAGLAPAASRVYGIREGVSIGGYGEVLLQKFDRERGSGAPSNLAPRLDVPRLITYVGFKFSDELLFNSEIEIEHSGIDDAVPVITDTTTGRGSGTLTGEVKLEFAYLDWMPRPWLGLRAGMLLVPVGLINELHEPPVFLGTHRNEVERNVIPATWSAIGAGIHGEHASGLAWRLYVVEGLDGANFSAGSAVRNGRQGGSRSLATHAAVTGRLDWSGAGALMGGSFFTGNAWQRPQPAGGGLSPVVTLLDVHGSFERSGLRARAVAVQGTLSDAGALSDALGLAGASRLGERFGGFTIEAGYDVLPLLASGTRYGLSPYARYERYDTQNEVPGGTENPAHEREIVTAGLEFRPHPNVVARADREMRRNQADTETSLWNVSLGLLF